MSLFNVRKLLNRPSNDAIHAKIGERRPGTHRSPEYAAALAVIDDLHGKLTRERAAHEKTRAEHEAAQAELDELRAQAEAKAEFRCENCQPGYPHNITCYRTSQRLIPTH